MLYTSFYDSAALDRAIDEGRYIVSISRTTPKWLEVDEKALILAPNWALFKARKQMATADYNARYIDQLNANKALILAKLRELDSKNAIMCCWCWDYDLCHRKALAQWAQKEGLVITELPEVQNAK